MSKIKVVGLSAVLGAASGFGAFAWIASAGDQSPFDSVDDRMLTLFSTMFGIVGGAMLGMAINEAREDHRD